jgi:hypothetical protein
MSCQHKITVYSGNGNTAAIVFGFNDPITGDPTLFDFSSVTRYLLNLEGNTSQIVDTAIDANAIVSAGAGTGELIFALGELGLPIDTFQGTLRIFNAQYPAGYLMDTGEGTTVEVNVI